MQKLSLLGSVELGNSFFKLFKQVPVNLTRYRELWLWWEQFCQGGAKETNAVCFKIDLSRVN